MTLLRAANVRLAFGSRTLFEDLTFVIEEGERVGLIGVNGSGKSTLMKILAGQARADEGELQMQRGARVTYLPQEPEFPEGATVEGVLTVADAPHQVALKRHAELSAQLAHAPADKQPRLLEELARAGVEAGLPVELATRLARETVAGSGELLHRSDLPPATLRQNVTSPGGTTAAALEVLMASDGLQPLMIRAIAAATKRSKELAK